MKLNDPDAIRYEFVDILFEGEDEPESTLVGIGDGKTIFDEDFPSDGKVFYYFEDEAEFEEAHDPDNFPSKFDFLIVDDYDKKDYAEEPLTDDERDMADIFASYGG